MVRSGLSFWRGIFRLLHSIHYKTSVLQDKRLPSHTCVRVFVFFFCSVVYGETSRRPNTCTAAPLRRVPGPRCRDHRQDRVAETAMPARRSRTPPACGWTPAPCPVAHRPLSSRGVLALASRSAASPPPTATVPGSAGGRGHSFHTSISHPPCVHALQAETVASALI
jgi:hypothetical protein